MTYAANVVTGYLAVTAAVLTYVIWVLRRGRSLGQRLGIGRAGSAGESPTEPSGP